MGFGIFNYPGAPQDTTQQMPGPIPGLTSSLGQPAYAAQLQDQRAGALQPSVIPPQEKEASFWNRGGKQALVGGGIAALAGILGGDAGKQFGAGMAETTNQYLQTDIANEMSRRAALKMKVGQFTVDSALKKMEEMMGIDWTDPAVQEILQAKGPDGKPIMDPTLRNKTQEWIDKYHEYAQSGGELTEKEALQLSQLFDVFKSDFNKATEALGIGRVKKTAEAQQRGAYGAYKSEADRINARKAGGTLVEDPTRPGAYLNPAELAKMDRQQQQQAFTSALQSARFAQQMTVLKATEARLRERWNQVDEQKAHDMRARIMGALIGPLTYSEGEIPNMAAIEEAAQAAMESILGASPVPSGGVQGYGRTAPGKASATFEILK